MTRPQQSNRRYLIPVGTTRLDINSAYNAPEAAQEIAELSDFFRRYLGYEIVMGMGPDLTLNDLLKRLRAFLNSPDRKEGDHIVLYYSGHADISNEQLVLLLRDSDPDHPESTGLNVKDLLRLLVTETAARNALVILDSNCGAAAIRPALMEAITSTEMPNRVDTAAQALDVLVSAVAREKARAGVFVRAFIRAITDPATGGSLQRHLSVQAIAAAMNQDPDTTSWQRIEYFSIGRPNSAFIPNPRYRPDLASADLLTQLAIESRQQQEEDIRNHFLPRAQGVDSTLGEGTRFVGREAILGRLLRWATTPDRPVRGPLTVWFNPWSYQSSEQIWAGLTREVIEACTDKVLLDRNSKERYWFAKNMHRLNPYALGMHC